jgi:MoaA/NifB/PqqE/SkfB family radical SAM enzyme
MGINEYLKVPEIAERYKKVKRYFFLRESAYEVTSACQLRCDGCYYFQGDKYKAHDIRDPGKWRAFMEQEKARGITYVNLAGAEPSMVPDILAACYEVIPLGTVFTNGLKPIDPAIRYRVQISVWGDSTGDAKYRKYAGKREGLFCLPVQLTNFRNDDRVIFVYTFNAENTNQVDEVVRMVSAEGHKLTFNVFSAPVGYLSPLRMGDGLKRTREKIHEVMERYPKTVVYSYYNAKVHTEEKSLHQQFGCPYPRASRFTGGHVGIGKTFHNVRTDLTHRIETDCCVPDTDCADCRHYAAGSAIVTSRLQQHMGSEMDFRGWLDYVDTYLATWVLGYQRGENLYPRATA